MKPILEVKGLAKKYRISHQSAGYLSFRERMINILRPDPYSSETFWALNNISFQIEPGESIGIIGPNGAGKSTLLKILSRITPPTRGKITMRGRVASLLEVGTGFHPELTGRENIFFNGSLLGMKKKEIQTKFDEIVDFSGTGKFLDTPLKHYSSGMQLRLAFSVSAFLDPEILIIDEVLAVGDAEFQRKCLEKMQLVSHSGKTILFVSHDLDSVEKLCKNSMLLRQGELVDSGPSQQLISNYLSQGKVNLFSRVALVGNIFLEKFIFPKEAFSGQDVEFSILLKKDSTSEFGMTDLCLLFYNYKKQRVAIYDMRNFFHSFSSNGDELTYNGKIKNFNLVEGSYTVGLFFGFNAKHGDVYDLHEILMKSLPDPGKVKQYDSQYRGYVDFNHL